MDLLGKAFIRPILLLFLPHRSLSGGPMTRLLAKWLKIYEDEIRLFLWATLLLFLIRSSDILFNNFAETAFLKRFGVEYLPIIYVVNSIATFIVMGFMAGFMARISGSRILAYMLILCGATAAAFRLAIPLGFELIYPLLFVAKSLYEVLLGMLFWNLANDLFDTRQSKRLFPLITAGGVIGGIIGSFGTPVIVKLIRIDNVLWVYLVLTLSAAAVVYRMATVFPTMSLSGGDTKKVKKRKGLVQEFKEVLPLIRTSPLIKILILLTLIPNVIIPILNYQFNFAVDKSFATEGGMIEFFGYLRGSLNIISFIILLFIGRVYGRWGLPVALMFHPFNYVLVFLAFLFRFDLLSAIYARMSTNVLRTTINNPARAVLMGLFPVEYRSMIRPFLRGTVVRIGILLGSGLIMASEGFMHPRHLSIVALVFVTGWIATTIVFKRQYTRILLDLISRNLLDMKSLEQEDASQIFKDKQTQAQLLEAFSGSKGSTCLWYADLIRSLGVPDLDAHILSVIRDQDDETRIGLLNLISKDAGPGAVELFEKLADPDKPDLTAAVLKAAAKMPSSVSGDFMRRAYRDFEDPEIKALAVAGLYGDDRTVYGPVISSWFASNDNREKRAGVIAASMSGDEKFLPGLKAVLAEAEDDDIRALACRALGRLAPDGLNELVMPCLFHASKAVRVAALEAVRIPDDQALRKVIPLLGDRDQVVRDAALIRLQAAEHKNPEPLIEALGLPDPRLRENVFDLLESMEVRDVEILRFARGQLGLAYGSLAEAAALRDIKDSPYRNLLLDHLLQDRRDRLETVLRVLSTQDRSGRMRLIWRGVFSADSRQRSNALEALEESVGHGLSKIMIPLLEEGESPEVFEVGRKEFKIEGLKGESRRLCSRLLEKDDWVTVMLALKVIEAGGVNNVDPDACMRFLDGDNPHIRAVARGIARGLDTSSFKETDMETSISIPDKILHLRGIEIFEGLSVGELAAIASVTEEKITPAGEDVICEGEAGETMYMIISGRVSVIKKKAEGGEIELDKINPGDYFGEMALFEDEVRSATIRTEEESRFLVLHKREFEEIVREYPQIALHICRVLSRRLRRLHNRFQQGDNE